MIFLKRQLPLAITFVVGVIFAVQYYVPHPISEEAITHAADTMKIVAAFALLLGIASLFHVHALKIKRQVPGWGYSFVLYLAMFVMIVIFWPSLSPRQPTVRFAPARGRRRCCWRRQSSS